MRTRKVLIVFAFIALGIINGCSKRYYDLPVYSAAPVIDAYNNSTGRFKTEYLADQINSFYRGTVNGPIAVSTFVNLDDLYSSSTFGRILSEQLMSDLAMRGYTVVEMRQAEALQILQSEGELGLSRDIEMIKPAQQISGLVVGTYAVSPVRVYINTRLIDPRTSLVASVGSVEISKTAEIARLLRGNTMQMTLERIPVKSLAKSPSSTVPFYWPSWQSYPPFGVEPNRFENNMEQKFFPLKKEPETSSTKAPEQKLGDLAPTPAPPAPQAEAANNAPIQLPPPIQLDKAPEPVL